MPGPNLMLPAIDLSSTPDLDSYTTYKLREAKWKQLVSKSHKAWCLCGSFVNHFILPTEPLCTEESSTVAGAAAPITRDAAVGTEDGGAVDGDPAEG